ncbi:DUF3854 domain-containing protein [Nostoc sp. FACHB-87]|uniref:DUF3854 domain-containing protein n=1 Tax=Nostocaceae TaxID=1162 RepID=UPI001689AA3A|nr:MULTISPECIES: DUF3854 domain-containing protein [Nostocaceae]MBD2303268.1 DUF3854 domain-containing protein [Nostoc sp. FACHB-190]MBD2458310.1 DUF3854 domain-containing protein [Nostoc sp. FACHB-87]MBD2479458.1 DUF3854 domain-containing protein [Anabaena sp. FACHB-83]
MFDERHLQLSSVYTKNSEYFIRTAIYPLVNFLCEKIIQRIKEELDNKLKLEVGEETYIMTPDEDGGWKWEKYDESANKFVPTTKEVEEELNELVSETLAEQVTSDTPEPKSDTNEFKGKLDGLDKRIIKAIYQTLFSDTAESKTNTTEEKVTESVESTPETETESTPNTNNQAVVESVKSSDFETNAESTPNTTSEVVVESYPSTDNTATKSTSNNEIIEKNTASQNTTVIEQTLVNKSSVVEHRESSKTIDASVSRLEPNHWREIVEGSAISPFIAELNFESLDFDSVEQQHQAWEYLIYSEKISRRNDGRLRDADLERYQHIEKGGWWCNAGVDPRSFANLQPGELPENKLWGCFKPNTPRPKKDAAGQIVEGKFIKYEHPPKTELSIFLLDVPDDIANKVYSKVGVQPSERDRVSGFWYCVWKHNVPITITEGAKKAASLLSQGYAAIGLPGIYAGYRSKDELGNQIQPVLHDELAVFATKERHINICFDYETKSKTKRNIAIATYRTGQLLESTGANVNVIQLPGTEKGVDDFIVAQGARAFEDLSQKAQPLEDWHKNNQQLDLRLTIFLKNGQEIRLYEQKGDGTVNVTPQGEEVVEEIFDNTPRKKVVAQESESEPDFTLPVMPGLPTFLPPQFNTDFDQIVADYHQQKQQAPTPEVSNQLSPSQNQQTKSWARQQRVTQYLQTQPRKRLEERENGEIALAAFHLVKNYGVRQESKDGDQEISIYQADAFAIKSNGDNYTIFRRSDKKVLMTFEADQSAKPTLRVTQKPQDMLSVERQEFLLVFDCIGKNFPSLDEDPRKIANTLGSLSPKGTHAILESFKQKEVFEVLAQTLSKFERDDLTLGNYRILYQKSQQDNSSRLQLLKTDNNGTTRVAASFDINKTPSGMTYQVKTLAINELDLNKLRLLAQKLDIPQKATTVNPYVTSDTEVAVHPTLAKYIDRLETTEQPPQANNSNGETFPVHPELKKIWQAIEHNDRWLPVDYNGRSILPFAFLNSGNLTHANINNNQGLTINEQRELYFAIHTQAQAEILTHKKTDIALSPWDDILKDLTQQPTKNTATATAQPQNQNTVNTTEGSANSKTSTTADTPQSSKTSTTTIERPIKRQTAPKPQSQTIKSDGTILPLHPELQRAWQELEDSKRWNPVAQQASNEFRDKIQTNQGLTISEQRELYFVIQAQAQVEIRTQEKTNIVLSPLNYIVKDLRQQSPLDNQTNHDQTRDTQLPLHSELAEHWQDLEVNKKWTGVADQWNYPLRQKLKETGKLTIGEQRELYQKLVVQREVELNRNQKSDISLPPFSQILDDLRCEREKAINNTYSPKIEVIKPQQHRNTTKFNEVEL